MDAWRSSLGLADMQPARSKLDLVPLQVAHLGCPQAMPLGDQDHCRVPMAVGLHEGDPLRHQEHRGRVVPTDAEPLGFGTGMQERSAAAVVGKPANPAADLVSVERRIEPHAPFPMSGEAIFGFA